MRIRLLIAFVLVTLLIPVSVQAKRPSGGNRPDCRLPESNADALWILSDEDASPGYWWDHTDLTVAVQAYGNAEPTQLNAIHAGIETWSETLNDCFGGLITLTDVTDSALNKQKADIVVHYMLRAGGDSFSGYAVCAAKDCPNVMVSSDFPASSETPPYSPEYLGLLTQHELGHALGLGHSTNLRESTDLMGYGWMTWPTPLDPVLSDCDIDALRVVFAWVFEGSEPHPPAPGPYDCSLD